MILGSSICMNQTRFNPANERTGEKRVGEGSERSSFRLGVRNYFRSRASLYAGFLPVCCIQDMLPLLRAFDATITRNEAKRGSSCSRVLHSDHRPCSVFPRYNNRLVQLIRGTEQRTISKSRVGFLIAAGKYFLMAAMGLSGCAISQ